MARSREFDLEKATEAAMKLFWARGYMATSLPDLLETMGIARSSFYATFGTKRELFIDCLVLFGDRTREQVLLDSQHLPAAALPRVFFESTLIQAPSERVKQGCMLVNSVLELADVEPELNRQAWQKLDAIQTVFERSFRVAQERAEMATTQSPKELAQRVMTINLGLRVHARQQKSAEQMQRLIDNSLAMIGLTA